MLSAIENFIQITHAIEEGDYGDFMRRANLYFQNLGDALEPTRNKKAKSLLEEMKNYLQFNPDREMSTTKFRLENDAKKLNQFLEADSAM